MTEPTASAVAVVLTSYGHPVVDTVTVLSTDVLTTFEDRQRRALAAVQSVLGVDQVIPGQRSRRDTVVGGAMGIADSLVTSQYELLDKVVHSAGDALKCATQA